MNDIVNADTAPKSPDLLTAASMPRVEGITKPPPVEIDDIVAAMRYTLMTENFSEFETMLATQACLMNMTFNRFIMSDLRSVHSPNGHDVGIALAAQRGVCNTLTALQRLRARAQSGKGTEGP